MLCEDTKDKEKAVAGIGNNGIREDSVGGGTAAPGTDEPADKEIVFLRTAINKFDQGTFVIGMNAHTAPAAADRADFRMHMKVMEDVTYDLFSRSFFTEKLAIYQIFSYHNSALINATCHLGVGQRPRIAWQMPGGRTDLSGYVLPLFYLVHLNYIVTCVRMQGKTRGFLQLNSTPHLFDPKFHFFKDGGGI